MVFNRFAIRVLRKYERGDVVALQCVYSLNASAFYGFASLMPRSPGDSKLVVKRVVALEGDTVRLEQFV